MSDSKIEFKKIVVDAVKIFRTEKNAELDESLFDQIAVETPPKPEMGDLGIPMFIFAKNFKMAPMMVSKEIARIINESAELSARARAVGEILAVGPYVNAKLNKSGEVFRILSKIEGEGENYGTLGSDGTPHLAGRKVMVEFSSPNTNKPLHLGHLRNDALGESVSRILKKAGAQVFKVDLINNRESTSASRCSPTNCSTRRTATPPSRSA